MQKAYFKVVAMAIKKTFSHPYVLLRMFSTAFFIGLVIYLAFDLYMTGKPKVYGMQILDEIMTLFLLMQLAQIVFIFLVTLKATLDTSYYLSYVADNYNVKLPSVTLQSKFKYVAIAVLYCLALLTLIYLTLLFIQNGIGILLFIPLYILIYQNWIYGLKLAIGNDFNAIYQEHRLDFMKKGIFYIMLMHIPFAAIFQPWFLMSLGDIYFKKSIL